jgi:hypothetical protein
MKIVSPSFEHMARIPSKYTCDGENVSPPLQISGILENAKSIALVMDDPDSPGDTWDHWVVFNILIPRVDGEEVTLLIEEGSEPKGVRGMNSWAKLGYGGPCPQKGEHKYFFKSYSLDIELNLVEGTTKADLENAMHDHVLEKAEIVGLYSRLKIL